VKIDYFKIERHVLVVSPLSQATTVVVSQASIVDGAISWSKKPTTRGNRMEGNCLKL